MDINTIMVVDDDAVSQMVVEVTISKLDPSIEIIKAEDGLEALEILDTLQKKPDVILLDINMPRMNGFEFLEEYQTRKDHSCVVAIHTSSHNEKDYQRTMQYEFVKTYFTKPIEFSDLESLKNL
jgi:CheY-like chemotaxis protein